MDYPPDLIVINTDMTDNFDDWKYQRTLIRDKEGNPWGVPQGSVLKDPFIDTEREVVQATPWNRMQLFLDQYSFTNVLIAQIKRKYFFRPENTVPDSKLEIYENSRRKKL